MNAVLNAALPIFALIGTGFLAGRRGLLDRAATDSLNRFAVYLALPALIFAVMAKVTPAQVAEGGYALAFGGGIVVTFAIAFVLARVRGERLAGGSIEGLNAAYANVGFMGIPLCLLVFGEASLPASIVAVLCTACGLFLFAVVLIEADLRRGAGRAETLRRVAVSLGRNPLLLAPLFGLAVAASGLPLPTPVDRFLALLGGAASPVALVCIGLFLAQERDFGEPRTVATLVVLKLVVHPGVTAVLAYGVFEMPPLWAKVALLSAALPIGTGPFTLAKLYGLDAGVTSGAILVSHVGSVVTVTLLVAWLG